MLNQLYQIIVAILVGFGVFFGVYQSGRKQGKKDLESENNDSTLKDLMRFKENEERIRALPDDELDNELSEWESK